MTRGPLQPDRHDDNAPDSRRLSLRAAHDRGATARVLIVAASAARREALCRSVRDEDAVCILTESMTEAMSLMQRHPADDEAQGPFGAVIVDVAACTPAALRFVREMDERHVPVVIVCPSVSFDEAVEAMRAGATDIIATTAKAGEMRRRIKAALGRRADHAEPAPAAARQQAAAIAPVEPSADDEAAEFDRLIRGELDVEALLRSVLEFVLAKCGPTNAAVFLPSATGDYSLGAYVNYSCPKDAAEVLLDHLANVAAPKLESLDSVVSMNTPASVQRHLGEGCGWIEDCQVAAFTCREQGECLAVFMIFRERDKPLGDRVMETLAMVSQRFARQLARVIRIHHRHLPRDQWGRLGDPADGADDGGMAA